MRPSPIYSSDFLKKHLHRAAVTMDRDQFVLFQVDALNELGKNFASDFLTVNILHLNDKFMLDGEIISAVAYNSQNTIESYQRALIHDDFTPITFLNSGTALFNTALRHMDDWIDQPIYTQHCTAYDHHWVLGVSYRFPHHKTTFVAFDYLKAKGEPFSLNLTEEYVEYVSYPFYLAWLHIHGAICAETLREWLSLCVGMSQSRFLVLRALAGQGIARTKDLASALQLAPGTIHRHIENAHLDLTATGKIAQEGQGNANRVLDLAQHYQFFGFGAGNAARNLPRRAFHV